MNTIRKNIWFFPAALATLALLGAGCAPASEEAAEPAEISVSLSTELDASAADVWKIVGDFGAIDFHRGIASVSVEGEGVGAIRTITIAGEEGGTIVERLDALDDEARSLTYTILESPLPVDNYTGTMAVSETEEGKTEFTWSSTFIAKGIPDEEAKALVEGFYSEGFEDLKGPQGE